MRRAGRVARYTNEHGSHILALFIVFAVTIILFACVGGIAVLIRSFWLY